MIEIVFTRDNWLPRILREDGRLRLEIIGGADALGDARRFTVPVSEEHLARIQEDLPRHVLVRGALLPLCYAAGSLDRIDERAAARLLDLILHGDESEVDTAFVSISWDSRRVLISHGADTELLDKGKALAAAQSVTASPSRGVSDSRRRSDDDLW